MTTTAHGSPHLTTAVAVGGTSDPVTAKKSGRLLVGSARALELAQVAEVASYWPFSRAKRVRRVLGFPVLYVGDPFAPRRPWPTAELVDADRPRLVVPVPQVRLAPALLPGRLPGGGCPA